MVVIIFFQYNRQPDSTSGDDYIYRYGGYDILNGYGGNDVLDRFTEVVKIAMTPLMAEREQIRWQVQRELTR